MSSDVLDKLILQCKKNSPTVNDLETCCSEILGKYQFESVFIGSATTPESEMVALAVSGKEEFVDICIYRLGVEEKIALTKLPIKVFCDITGKPIFNKTGSLRMQKPSSGLFMAYNTPGKEYLLLGCGHMDSRTYEQPLIQDLSQLWTMWKELLSGTIFKINQNTKMEPSVSPAVTSAVVTEHSVIQSEDEIPILEGLPHRSTLLVDKVTRLYNKSYFDESLSIEVERARRYTRNMCVLILSVGHVNFSNSIDENMVAAHIAEVLIKSLRRVDVICRVSKEQYAIILPDTATNTCGIIAKRVFKFFKQVMGEQPPIFINLSASAYPETAVDAKGLYEKALVLLQQAQNAGPNKAVLAD
jgi:diguanylate cyclase (GGDEF)-like protein